jgi:hypothetical protein
MHESKYDGYLVKWDSMKTHGTATDKLADVIQALQLVRKSGRLTAQRDASDGIAEIGIIVFREGQVIDASVGQLRGADAFKKLVVWTRCHFLFEAVPAASPPIAPSSPTLGAFPRSESGGNAGVNDNDAEWRHPQQHSDEYLTITLIPFRSQHMQGVPLPDFQRIGLQRLHRQLFLLIDGKRTTQELARLIGRQHQEVLMVLADLESTGLIGH